MPILGNEMKRRKGAVKGRECRNRSLNTKLTATEAAAVDAAADSEGKAVGEWLRDLVLARTCRGTTSIAIPGDYRRNCGHSGFCSSTHLNRFCAATR